MAENKKATGFYSKFYDKLRKKLVKTDWNMAKNEYRYLA